MENNVIEKVIIKKFDNAIKKEPFETHLPILYKIKQKAKKKNKRKKNQTNNLDVPNEIQEIVKYNIIKFQYTYDFEYERIKELPQFILTRILAFTILGKYEVGETKRTVCMSEIANVYLATRKKIPEPIWDKNILSPKPINWPDIQKWYKTKKFINKWWDALFIKPEPPKKYYTPKTKTIRPYRIYNYDYYF